MSDPALYGLVLAGGASQRMGADKAALPMGNHTFLERSVRQLEPWVADVYVSARAEQQDDLRDSYQRIDDELGDAGPAAGVLAAHAKFPAVAWLVVACDMPKLEGTLLETLVRQRDAEAGATAFAAPGDGRPEPLCAIYEPATLAAFATQVAGGGSSSLRGLLAGLGLSLLQSQDEQALTNVNTPEELARITQQSPQPGTR